MAGLVLRPEKARVDYRHRAWSLPTYRARTPPGPPTERWCLTSPFPFRCPRQPAGWPWIFTQLAVNAPGYDPNSLASQYSAALYYAFVLVVGSDNLPAANNVERVFYVLMLIAGAVMYALIVSWVCDVC